MQKYVTFSLIIIFLLTLLVWGVSQFGQPLLPSYLNNWTILFFAALIGVTTVLANLKDIIDLFKDLIENRSLFDSTKKHKNPTVENVTVPRKMINNIQPKNNYKWDIFISYASEDKESVAKPLTDALTKRGFRVWLDEQQLQVGDSLRRKIDEGLAKSRFGVVVLSKNFFNTEWSQKELDALVSRDDGMEKVILPVWHEISKSDIAQFSLILSDKFAVSTSKGLERVADEIQRVVS